MRRIGSALLDALMYVFVLVTERPLVCEPEPRLRRRVLTCDGGLRPPQWPWSAAPIVSEREVGGRVAVRAAPATSGRADGEFLTAPAFVYGTASGRTPHTPRTCAHFELQHIPV